MAGRLLEHLELLSISEKDEQYYKTWIGDKVQELAQSCLGIRRWIKYKSAITFLSRFSYFSLTTLSNIPTPGEEYCEATVGPKSFLRKLMLTFFNNELRLPPEIPKQYVVLLKDLHLIAFFLFGDFYELHKRILGYEYMTLDTNTYQSKRMNSMYKLIGCLSIVKLIITMKKFASKENNDSNVIDSNGSKTESLTNIQKTNDSNMTCQLCSDTRMEPTSTICGHIFCWYCIHQWLKEKSECPICRTPTEPSRLIHLINFK